jgi:hypothetical protein
MITPRRVVAVGGDKTRHLYSVWYNLDSTITVWGSGMAGKALRPYGYRVIDDRTAGIPVFTPDGFVDALVDIEFAEELSKYTWSVVGWGVAGTGYARAWINGRTQKMHRVILGLGKGDKNGSSAVDHDNGNKLDNRLCNISVVTPKDNALNRSKAKTMYSKYVGVSWHKRDKRWVAGMRKNGKPVQLGYFKSEEEAARAYDRELIALHPDSQKIRLNFPEEYGRDR